MKKLLVILLLFFPVHGAWAEQITLECTQTYTNRYNAHLDKKTNVEFFKIDLDTKTPYILSENEFIPFGSKKIKAKITNETIEWEYKWEYKLKDLITYKINRTTGTLHVKLEDFETKEEKIEAWENRDESVKKIHKDIGVTKENYLRNRSVQEKFQCKKIDKKKF